MSKVDIKKVIEKGSATKLTIVDYDSVQKQKDLRELEMERTTVLKNKQVDWERLKGFYITK